MEPGLLMWAGRDRGGGGIQAAFTLPLTLGGSSSRDKAMTRLTSPSLLGGPTNLWGSFSGFREVLGVP